MDTLNLIIVRMYCMRRLVLIKLADLKSAKAHGFSSFYSPLRYVCINPLFLSLYIKIKQVKMEFQSRKSAPIFFVPLPVYMGVWMLRLVWEYGCLHCFRSGSSDPFRAKSDPDPA